MSEQEKKSFFERQYIVSANGVPSSSFKEQVYLKFNDETFWQFIIVEYTEDHAASFYKMNSLSEAIVVMSTGEKPISVQFQGYFPASPDLDYRMKFLSKYVHDFNGRVLQDADKVLEMRVRNTTYNLLISSIGVSENTNIEEFTQMTITGYAYNYIIKDTAYNYDYLGTTAPILSGLAHHTQALQLGEQVANNIEQSEEKQEVLQNDSASAVEVTYSKTNSSEPEKPKEETTKPTEEEPNKETSTYTNIPIGTELKGKHVQYIKPTDTVIAERTYKVETTTNSEGEERLVIHKYIAVAFSKYHLGNGNYRDIYSVMKTTELYDPKTNTSLGIDSQYMGEHDSGAVRHLANNFSQTFRNPDVTLRHVASMAEQVGK